MYIATSDDFDKVWNIFKENKKWFPHVRSFHIRNRLKWGQVVFENNVVITHQIYKRNGKIGHNTDVVTQKGDCILHQIVKGQDGNARKTMEDFFNSKLEEYRNNYKKVLLSEEEYYKQFSKRMDKSIIDER